MSNFKMPVDNPKLTSKYNPARKHPSIKGVIRKHAGVDLVNAKLSKAPIYATADGTVRLVKTTQGGYGKHLIITHSIDGQKYESVYAHLDSFTVAQGAKVKRGQQIGLMGNTGIGTGVHLHFEIHKGTYNYGNGTYPNSIDPWPLISGLQLSESGLAFIKKHEGHKLYWYELADGGLTCGYGHYVPLADAKKLRIKKGATITQAQADAYLKQDMQKFVEGTNAQLQQYGLTVNQNQFDALVSYAFNRGLGKSTGINGLRQLLKNSKTVAAISKNLVVYWGTNATYKDGLINRRKAEQVLFNTVGKTSTTNKGDDELVFANKDLKALYETRHDSKATKELLIAAAAKHLNINPKKVSEGDLNAVALEVAVHFAKQNK